MSQKAEHVLVLDHSTISGYGAPYELLQEEGDHIFIDKYVRKITLLCLPETVPREARISGNEKRVTPGMGVTLYKSVTEIWLFARRSGN